MTLLGPHNSGKTTSSLHALVLAAGRGCRFGGGKLHAHYRGRPLLSHGLEVVEAACSRGLLDGGHVVVAGTDERALSLVQDTTLQAIVNDAPDEGLSRSLRLGLEMLEHAQQSAAAMVFLGDQPRVRLEVIEQLVEAWRGARGTIIRPRYAARPDAPGHPVVLARLIWPRARQLQGDLGFSALLDSSSRETVLIDVPGDNPDVDTPADLQVLEESSS